MDIEAHPCLFFAIRITGIFMPEQCMPLWGTGKAITTLQRRSFRKTFIIHFAGFRNLSFVHCEHRIQRWK